MMRSYIYTERQKYNRQFGVINNTKFKIMTKVSKKQKQSESIDPDIDGCTVLYAVLRLCQSITYTDPFTGEERKEKIQGIAGYIPCFKTTEEAEKYACDGKFEIVAIRPA